MKHYFYVVVAFLTLSAGAFAQKKITVKDLEGSWKLISYADDHVVINTEEGTFTFTSFYEQSLSAAELKKEKEFYTGEMEYYKGGTIAFKSNKLTVTMAGESKSGKYELNA